MPPPLSNVIGYLRSVLGPDADSPSDAQLLARFADYRDEAAFELLVWRHAGLVLRVCRDVLRDHHAAEDATQATFLALAKQARIVGRRGTVAGWLYRVARRIAARSAKRRRAEPTGTNAGLDQVPGQTTVADPELVRLIHDELDRLPDKYRTPVLLCFFERLTYADAARRLGWPVGTVATRVARAKDRMQRRLVGRGVILPAAGLAAACIGEPASAVGPAFIGATARAAVAFAGKVGAGVEVSRAVLTLAKGEVQAMTVMKLQWAAGVMAACGVMTFGGAWVAGQGSGPQPVPEHSGKSPPPTSKMPTVKVMPPAEPAFVPLDQLPQQEERSRRGLRG